MWGLYAAIFAGVLSQFGSIRSLAVGAYIKFAPISYSYKGDRYRVDIMVTHITGGL